MEYVDDPNGCRYASGDDIRTKLHGCFILYDGVPVIVETGVDSDYRKISIQAIDDQGRYSGEPRVVKVTDPKVEQYEFNLGWMNVPSKRGGSSFVSYGERSPVRRCKQGLTPDSVFFHAPNADGVSFTRYNPSSGELACLMRKEYPTLDTALSKILNKLKGDNIDSHVGVALSNEVALVVSYSGSKDYALVYVDRMVVGKYHFDTRSLESTKQGMYSIVARSLAEVGIE